MWAGHKTAFHSVTQNTSELIGILRKIIVGGLCLLWQNADYHNYASLRASMGIKILKALKSPVSKKIKPVFPKYMYLSIHPIMTWLFVSLTFISPLLLAVELGAYSRHQWNGQMFAVPASLIVGGGCVITLWLVRNK